MMRTLITPYQQSLLELVFGGNARSRDKFNLVIADGIKVHQNGTVKELYPPGKRLGKQELIDWENEIKTVLIDGEEIEAELRQILSEVQQVQVLATGSFVITGSHGVLFVRGPLMRVEEAMSTWMFLNAAAVFLENLYHRLFSINSNVIEIQNMLEDLERNPNSIEIAQEMLVTNSSEISFIDEIITILEAAVERQESHYSAFLGTWKDATRHHLADGSEGSQREADNLDFGQIMGITKMCDNTNARIDDMKNTVNGTNMRLKGLRDNVNATSERRMHQVQMELQENSRTLEDITRTNERTGSSLQILELILAAALAFELLGMTVGEWSAESHLEEAGAWVYLTQPGVMLAIATIGWLFLALLLIRKVKGSEKEARQYLSCRITYNTPCNTEKMTKLIEKKRARAKLIDLDGDVRFSGERIKTSWKSTDPKWRFPYQTTFREWMFRKEKETEVTLVYDSWNGFLLYALVEVPSPPFEMTIDDLERILSEELVEAGVMKEGIVAKRHSLDTT
jgi:hypothetical protein